MKLSFPWGNKPDDLEAMKWAIREDNQQLIQEYYLRYRRAFVGFLKKNFSVDEEQAVDLYHDSFLALYRNIQSGQLNVLSCSLRTYLFQIGKNQANKAHHNRKEVVSERLEDVPDQAVDTESEEWYKMQQEVYELATGMKEPCNRVLTLFFEEKSMREIAMAMGYKSADVAKTRKSTCVKLLEQLIIKKLKN